MGLHLVFSPAEAVDKILPPVFRFKMKIVNAFARVFKFWDYPSKSRATDYIEMSNMDFFYWLYKGSNPIMNFEKGKKINDLIATDSSIVGLPQGFEKQAQLTLGAAGDLLYADCYEHSKDILFEKVEDLLFDQDIAYANFESPIAQQPPAQPATFDLEKEPPMSFCSPAQFDIFKGHKDKRFNVLHTANNHTFDIGVQGVEDTLKAFAKEGILDVGTNSSPAEYGQGKIIAKNGIKLGFVSATFGLNGRTVPPHENYRVNHSRILSKLVDPELDLLQKQITHCKSQNCDFIIASVHWGYEFEFFPREKQIRAAHELVEMGADAIICHHTHVIQPVEYYRTKRDADRVAVIAYSLGSPTWTFAAPHLILSAILNLTLAKGAFKGKGVTYIEKAKVTPVFRNYTDAGGKTVTRIEKLADHLKGSNQNAPSIGKMKEYVDLVFKEHAA